MQIRIVGSPYTMKQEKEPSENPPYFLTLVQVVARFFDDIWVAASLFESGNRRKGDLEAFLDHFLSTFSTLNNLHLVANVPNQAVI